MNPRELREGWPPRSLPPIPGSKAQASGAWLLALCTLPAAPQASRLISQFTHAQPAWLPGSFPPAPPPLDQAVP